jgi:hypothetical protein
MDDQDREDWESVGSAETLDHRGIEAGNADSGPTDLHRVAHADATFAKPESYEQLGQEGIRYAVR